MKTTLTILALYGILHYSKIIFPCTFFFKLTSPVFLVDQEAVSLGYTSK